MDPGRVEGIDQVQTKQGGECPKTRFASSSACQPKLRVFGAWVRRKDKKTKIKMEDSYLLHWLRVWCLV